MSTDFLSDPAMAMKQAQDMELVKRKMDIDAMRKHLTPGPDHKSKLKEACQGFETMFIQKIWEQMRNNVPKEGYLHSKQEAMYQSMYDHEFSKKMAEAGGIGLGDMLYEQLSQSLGESTRGKTPGLSSRMPLIPATSSPSGMRYAENLQQALEIKPVYEDAADLDQLDPVDLEQFAIHGAKNASGIAVTRSNPWLQSVTELREQRSDGAGDADMAAIAAQMNGILTPETGGAQNAGQPGQGLDFEAISQEMLEEEMQQSAAGVAGPDLQAGENRPEVAQAPTSVYAQAFNRRHAAGILTPEQSQALAEALKENSRTARSGQAAASEAGSLEMSAAGTTDVSGSGNG